MGISPSAIIDRDAANSLSYYSGGDGVVTYWINKRGAGQRYGLPFSRPEIRFIRRTFKQIDRLTGLTFQEVASQSLSNIDVNCVRGRTRLDDGKLYDGVAFPEDSWWNIFITDYGRSRLTRREKYIIRHEIAHTVGLGHPNGRPRSPLYSTQDTIMSYNGPGINYTPADIQAMQTLWGSS